HFSFSTPSVYENDNFSAIDVKEADEILSMPSYPSMPYKSEVLTFPFGTKIESIDVKVGNVQTMHIGKKIIPAAEPVRADMSNAKLIRNEGEIYRSNEGYPSKWVDWNAGAGIENGKHVVFLSIHAFPARYIPAENELQYVNNVSIEIKYTPPSEPLLTNDVYDLLIVTPSQFSNALQPLVDHKNSHGVSTMLVTLDEIYNGNYFSVQGRDDAEKIKYFIKDAVEEWGVKYVMLVGDIGKMPIRYIFFAQKWQHRYYNETMPTDLYYADIYDANGSFSSWDSNGNGVYGEEFDNCEGVNDTMDMYADVYIGRLACKNRFVAKTVVNKIISYEDKAFGEDWFKRLVLIGGDTFPEWGVVEGEFMNQLVADEMPDFNPVKIWYSLGNLNAMTIEKELEKGAGFVHFSGHGFPWGWGTHPVNGDDNEWVGTYYTPYVTALFNGYRLPVIFFDACSTGELDLTVSDIGKEFGVPMPNISVSLPCFAWYFVQKRGGGAIATVGSTRVAFTGVDSNGPYAGAGYLVYKFFDGYHKGATPSEMLVHSQNEYMNNEWKDRWSICEFILFGDPSLHIGGFE
ncbi:MAG: hypothetical protein DRN17_03300, partial [Thermoplasmata archaeon]